MTRSVIYLDETGDLGFNFGAPYRQGGSSRYLTLGAAICPDDSKKYIKRFIIDFYKARKIPAGSELKWSNMDAADRLDFATRAATLAHQRPPKFASITVYKPNVRAHIQADPNKLYNYMVGLLLIPIMRRYDQVHLMPDARAIKVESGNSLSDYLMIKLRFDIGATTQLRVQPTDSAPTLGLHFADYVCGTFQAFHEDGHAQGRNLLAAATTCKSLFFPS